MDIFEFNERSRPLGCEFKSGYLVKFNVSLHNLIRDFVSLNYGEGKSKGILSVSKNWSMCRKRNHAVLLISSDANVDIFALKTVLQLTLESTKC